METQESDSFISKNQIALAGEFAVLSQLALRGYDANMTLGNTKSVDILLSHPATQNMYKLEVKTHFDNAPYRSGDFGLVEASWRMGDKHETITDPTLFYCFVSIADSTHHFDFYIVPSSVVAKFVKESHAYWLSHGERRNDSSMRKFMLGKGGEKYNLDMPLVDEYKNRWDFLK